MVLRNVECADERRAKEVGITMKLYRCTTPHCFNLTRANATQCPECLNGRKCKICGIPVGKAMQYCDVCRKIAKDAAQKRAHGYSEDKKLFYLDVGNDSTFIDRRVTDLSWLDKFKPIIAGTRQMDDSYGKRMAPEVTIRKGALWNASTS